MASGTLFLKYWVLAFVTLAAALTLLSLFYRFIDSDLHLRSLAKEAVLAATASAVQAAGFWFSASLFQGNAFHRGVLFIPFLIVGFIYWIAHVEDWSGYEFGGIALFQAAIWVTGFCLMSGQVKLAAITLGVFAIGLAIIASIAKSL